MPDWQLEAWPPDAAKTRPCDLYLRPCDLFSGTAAKAALARGAALPLAGGPVAFRRCELVWRGPGGVRRWRAPLPVVEDWARRAGDAWATRIAGLAAGLTGPRPPFAGLALASPRLFGVLNVTPDSFSDGGDHAESQAAIAYGRFLAEAGAAVVDVGGESTRPGAAPVTAEAELRRVLPVVRNLAAQNIPVSIDTRHAAVMDAALAAGARVVNDVTALTHDARSLPLVAERQAAVVLMHMQGEPKTMQENPIYEDVTLDVFDYLEARVAACEKAGIRRGNLCVDPGIGFGKTAAHNREVLERLGLFHGLGAAILIGVSRKSFLAGPKNLKPKQRLAPSLAAGLTALNQGVQFLRVHDVPESALALRAFAALSQSPAR